MEQYVIRGGRPGYDRLRILARSWEPTTSKLLDRVGVAAGAHCLDLGCGAGDVTFELARRAGSGGRAVGVDMDEVKLDLARADAAAQGLATVEFRTMNVYEWDDPASYDVVYCRNLLQHLSRPADVLRAMWAALRPGGALVVEDADFSGGFCEPPDPGYAFWLDAYPRVLAAHGGDPASGRRLHLRFAEAGLPAPELSVVQRVDVSGEAKTMPYLTIEATAAAILAEGIATAADIDVALVSLRRLAGDPATVCGSPRLFQAWARRPA